MLWQGSTMACHCYQLAYKCSLHRHGRGLKKKGKADSVCARWQAGFHTAMGDTGEVREERGNNMAEAGRE